MSLKNNIVFKAQTEWVKPTEFPDLRFCNEIAIDLETHDPELKTMGSGAVVGKGKVVGIAVATEGYSGYFPFDHEGGGDLGDVPQDPDVEAEAQVTDAQYQKDTKTAEI